MCRGLVLQFIIACKDVILGGPWPSVAMVPPPLLSRELGTGGGLPVQPTFSFLKAQLCDGNCSLLSGRTPS